MTNGRNTNDYLVDASDEDLEILMLMQNVATGLREELGDSWERWEGAAIVASWIIPAFADHFGHNLLFNKRQPPKPNTVRSFALIIGLLDAIISDGPPES